jgi:hypothetical protein
MTKKYEVCVIESESGWGQRRDYELFDSFEKAKKYRDQVNSRNEPMKKGGNVPDWYMIAEQTIQTIEIIEE